ncbi:MAG: DUF3383 domain-containing protein [bacterium]|nr:DUF3383 domain-containing protein [bacterium]
MGNINDIAVVNITRQSKTVSRVGFGIPLIMGSNCTFAERVRAYSTLSGVAEDFNTTNFEYIMAQKIFSQAIHPAQIKIGRCGTAVKMKVKVTPGTPSEGDIFTTTINGTAYSVVAGAGDAVADIIDDLMTAITGGAEPVTMTDNATDFDIEANVAGVDFTIKITRNISILSTNEYNEDASDAFNAIKEEDDDFYFLILSNRTKAEIEDVAAAIEATTKIFLACSFDSDVKTTGSSDVASTLKTSAYERTGLLYSENPEDAIDAAWIGLMAPKTPGSATWNAKPLSGVSADSLTDTEINNVLGKNANIYDTIGGNNITREGTVASGEYIDIMRGTDWIHVNVQADVYDGITGQDKIPFTNAGIDIIRNIVLAVLNRAVANGILKNDPAPEFNAPDVANISNADKVARFLQNIGFSGYYKGAIHKVSLDGNLSV